MTASWCPSLRHLADKTDHPRDSAPINVAAKSRGPKRINNGGNSPAHALGKSELAYEVEPPRQAEEQDVWQSTPTTSRALGGSAAASSGGAPRKSDRAEANKTQEWTGTDSSWYHQSQPNGKAKDEWSNHAASSEGWSSNRVAANRKQAWSGADSTRYGQSQPMEWAKDEWSARAASNKNWSSTRGGNWAGNKMGAAWPQAGQVGGYEREWNSGRKPSPPATNQQEHERMPLRQQGKAAPYAKAAAIGAESASAAKDAAKDESAPSGAQGKSGKTSVAQDARLKWVEKEGESDQLLKSKDSCDGRREDAANDLPAPIGAKDNRGKKDTGKDAKLKWVEKDAASEQPSKGKASHAGRREDAAKYVSAPIGANGTHGKRDAGKDAELKWVEKHAASDQPSKGKASHDGRRDDAARHVSVPIGANGVVGERCEAGTKKDAGKDAKLKWVEKEVAPDRH